MSARICSITIITHHNPEHALKGYSKHNINPLSDITHYQNEYLLVDVHTNMVVIEKIYIYIYDDETNTASGIL